MAEKKIPLPDKIQAEGVCCMGYGVIPKYVMQDQELSLTAKSLYAYFCSLSGNGQSSFPGQETIKAHLQLGNKAYYKHRDFLIQQGYVKIEARRVGNQHFAQNLYTLISNPKKFDEAPAADMWKSRIYGQIRTTGLKSAGYGIIPRAVMYDDRLDAKAKGVYAYFASYAGNSDAAFPSVPKLVEDLDISKSTYLKAMKVLQDCNYIEVRQRNGQAEGKRGFNVNDYFLIDSPGGKKAQTTKAQTEKAQTENAQATKAQPKKAQTKKANANINTFSTSNTPSININPSKPKSDRLMIDQKNKTEQAIGREDYEDAIREAICLEDIPLLSPSTDMGLVSSLVTLMATACVGEGSVRIGKEEIPKETVKKVFLGMEGEQLLYAIECVKKQGTRIRNIRAYYLTALFHAPETCTAYYENLVNADLAAP